MSRKNEFGFTLVELAISLMIIGLLLVGVLKGQELMENSRVAGVVRQVQSIDAAASTFNETYGALPGDIVDPGTRIPGCTSANCTTAGNGDGIIGTPQAIANGSASAVAAGTENRMFFLHLAQAGLIQGVALGYTGSAVNFGVSYPETPLGGGLMVVNYINTAGDTLFTGPVRGHYLIVRAGTTDNLYNADAWLMTGHQAAMIDRKMDEGYANTGNVLGIGQIGTTGTCLRWIDSGTNVLGYLETSRPQRYCVSLIGIQH